MSSGSPMRPMGMAALIARSISGVSPPRMGVWIWPGKMVLTRMPSPTNSSAAALPMIRMAPLLAW